MKDYFTDHCDIYRLLELVVKEHLMIDQNDKIYEKIIAILIESYIIS